MRSLGVSAISGKRSRSDNSILRAALREFREILGEQLSDQERLNWAIPPVRLGLSGRNSGKDHGNALRAFPGISLESTAGMRQTL